MYNVASQIRQLPSVDTTAPLNTSNLAGKVILIIEGASEFGAAWARNFANYEARLMIGDVADSAGHPLVAELRQLSNSDHHHYVHCDVTDWQSQVDFFREVVRLSPHRGVDVVIANAGVAES